MRAVRTSLQAARCGAALFACAGAARAQSCAPFWLRPAKAPGDAGSYGAWKAVFDDGTGPALFARYGDGYQHDGMARWRGYVWERLDEGLAPVQTIEDVRVLDGGDGPHVYAEGGTPPNWAMWVWDGSRWQPTPPGFFYSDARPYCSFDDGTGMAIYGQAWVGSLMQFARWDGRQWVAITPMGITEPFQMRSLDIGDGPAVYLSGFHSMPALPNARGIARWNGHQLSALGSGFSGTSADTRALIVFDDGHGRELYVGGGHTGLGGVAGTSGLARWNGQRWAAVPGHSGAGVLSLEVFDDGSGPALFVAGAFDSEGGVPARHIARFDGAAWSALGAGVPSNSGYMTAFTTDPRGPSLFVWASGAGTVGGSTVISSGDYQWVGCPNCYANCDNSTQSPRLNVLDFLCFLNKFAARDPYANCTVDATIDIADFICFLNKFAAGCP